MPVLGYKRSKKRSDFLGSADYGYCASRHLRYFGYKLVMISTVDGIPLCYELTAANTDERQAAETVLAAIKNVVVIADKGFLGAEWQARIQEETGNRILTPRRKTRKPNMILTMRSSSTDCEGGLKGSSMSFRTQDATWNVC